MTHCPERSHFATAATRVQAAASAKRESRVLIPFFTPSLLLCCLCSLLVALCQVVRRITKPAAMEDFTIYNPGGAVGRACHVKKPRALPALAQ